TTRRTCVSGQLSDVTIGLIPSGFTQHAPRETTVRACFFRCAGYREVLVVPSKFDVDQKKIFLWYTVCLILAEFDLSQIQGVHAVAESTL
ncbi:MAG TPA: hypothetical protein PLX99_08350, partial [Gammaproteobacteria bacterium]|nr:hypothetical protein [Gammaproteobacteria bacterium]